VRVHLQAFDFAPSAEVVFDVPSGDMIFDCSDSTQLQRPPEARDPDIHRSGDCADPTGSR
jgi:hypothetical protein